MESRLCCPQPLADSGDMREACVVEGGGLSLAILGILFAMVIVIAIRRRRSEARRMADTPTSPIAGAPSGRVIEICGTVGPTEQGTIVSPVSGKETVLYHAEVIDDESDVVHTANDRRDFWLRDASGGYARILPMRSEMIARSTQYGELTSHSTIVIAADAPHTKLPMTPEVLSWAQRSSNHSTSELLVREILFAPGDQLYVLGYGERGPDGVLLLQAGAGSERALFISNLDEAELRQFYRDQVRMLWIGVGLMLALAALGVTLIILS